MKLIKSNQTGIFFAFCPSPVTIDKRESWGPDETNFQQGPDGAWLKMSWKDDQWVVSHLVQPNADNSAPKGWIQGSGPGLFDKEPIWIDDSKSFQIGEIIEMDTIDGPIKYEVKEPVAITYNGDENGPDKRDGWVQTIANIKKNYQYS